MVRQGLGRGSAAKLEADDYDLHVKRIKLRKQKVSVVEPKFPSLHVDELAKLYLKAKINDGWSDKSAYNYKAFMNAYV